MGDRERRERGVSERRERDRERRVYKCCTTTRGVALEYANK